jgi:molybdopterin-binding protein
MARVIIPVVLLGTIAGCAPLGSIAGGNVLTDNLSEPLDGATTARIDINTPGGNLTADRLSGDGSLLASGTLQYYEKQAAPARTLNTSDGQTTLTLKGAEANQPWFRLPWAACNAATEWHIHLNPAVALDISAHSGGNVNLNLAGLTLTRVAADSGGGNLDVVLPDNAADLDVTAKTGAGNVTVEIGDGVLGTGIISARSGAGNVIVDVIGG